MRSAERRMQNPMIKKYSVLMSVYIKENPQYLRAAIDSMLNQTLLPDEFILVCDGPLTDGLERVLKEYSERVHVVRLKENRGLGAALSEGLNYCKNEWVARMDSDDLAAEKRCELQMKYLEEHSGVDVLSGTVAEFRGGALSTLEAGKTLICYKRVPLSDQEIQEYIKYRNPINHPCVMFRKSRVLSAGSYQPCKLFEDYDLWIRMMLKRCEFANLEDILIFMRVNDMYRRRGGWEYARAVVQFQKKMYNQKVINLPQYLFNVCSRVGVSVMPTEMRKKIYEANLRT